MINVMDYFIEDELLLELLGSKIYGALKAQIVIQREVDYRRDQDKASSNNWIKEYFHFKSL